MSTAGEEHHRSHTAGNLFMGLLAAALALTAAYLWLSDGTRPWRFTLPAPASPPAAAAAIAPPVNQSVATTRAPPTPARAIAPVAPAAAPTTAPVPASADQTAAVAAQVAADAAAVGMTSRVRPSDPPTPGQ